MFRFKEFDLHPVRDPVFFQAVSLHLDPVDFMAFPGPRLQSSQFFRPEHQTSCSFFRISPLVEVRSCRSAFSAPQCGLPPQRSGTRRLSRKSPGCHEHWAFTAFRASWVPVRISTSFLSGDFIRGSSSQIGDLMRGHLGQCD